MSGKIFSFPRASSANGGIASGDFQELLSVEDLSKPPDPDSVLADVASAHGIGLQLEVIWHAWPSLRASAERLIHHLGGKFPGQRKPLVEEVLLDASDAYAACAGGQDPKESAAKFLWSLISASDQILLKRVVAHGWDGSVSAWDQFETDLPSWLRGIHAASIEIQSVPYLTDIERVGGRQFLAHRILDYRSLGMMQLHSPRGLDLG